MLICRIGENMKLNKAIGIVNWYAYAVLNGKDLTIENLAENEIEELEEAHELVKEFVKQISN